MDNALGSWLVFSFTLFVGAVMVCLMKYLSGASWRKILVDWVLEK